MVLFLELKMFKLDMEGFVFWEILVIVELVFFCRGSWGKECTNIPTELSSHTLISEHLGSHSHTSNGDMLFHDHLTPTDESAWADLLPRKILGDDGDEFFWAMTYREIKNSWSRFNSSKASTAGINGGNGGGENFLKEFSLHDVKLSIGSLHWRAQQTNLQYLLMLDVDRLVWNFRNTSGLIAPGMPYGGWEKPISELRGHFIGHYLSASAMMWASTNNDNLKEKMSSIVSALYACQEKIGTGYLSAFPSEFFDRFEAIKIVWAPYYTIHKIMAGLLDQYSYVGDSRALKMVTWMAEYFYIRVKNVILTKSIEQHWKSLNEETGGMNDVLYNLFTITGNQTHLFLAHLFDKPCFLGMLAVEADSLSGFHANTHIPIVIGSQMRYEVTGDSLYKEIGTFFMNIVNSSHTYATGGTSISEFWSDPKRLATTLKSENEESCTTYNMLKVARHLFTWTKEMAYADYYERALTNGVLGIQRGSEPGRMIYMLPLAAGSSKAKTIHGWGNPTESFWCCYGTGIESFSKLGDSIYFEGQEGAVYVVQYISSTLNLKSAQILIDQEVSPVTSVAPYLHATFTIYSKGTNLSSTLNMRIPIWSSSIYASADLNGQKFTLMGPGHFHSISVKPGDIVTLHLPINLRTEAIKDDRPEYASIQAILYGPYLLAGFTSGDWGIKTGPATSISDWITPIPSAAYNSDLITLWHDSNFVLANSNRSITMENTPQSGTDASVHATFRLVAIHSESQIADQRVRMEPFDYPGMVLTTQGTDLQLVVAELLRNERDSVFLVVGGRNGKEGYVSLESESHRGCFVYSGDNFGAAQRVKLNCTKGSDGMSFMMKKGIQEYDPISFVAKGAKRDFLLSPLLSFRDESYTVYFNIQA